jgi:hypothetical protein
MSTSRKQLVLAVKYEKHQQIVYQGLLDLLMSYRVQIIKLLLCF